MPHLYSVGDIVWKGPNKAYSDIEYPDEPGTKYEVLLVGMNDIIIAREHGNSIENARQEYENYEGISDEDWDALDANYPGQKVSGICGRALCNWMIFNGVEKDRLMTKVNQIGSLTEQQKKDREFFFSDLTKPYKAPVDESGQRIGLEFL